MHGSGHWSLSPAYDINPVPEVNRARVNKMPISEDREEPSIDRALYVAPRFGIKASDAKKILREVLAAVSTWRATGRMLGIKPAKFEAYTSAFEHDIFTEARQILRS